MVDTTNSSFCFLETCPKIVSTIANLYEKTENSLDEDVKKIKIWMETQPHLPEIMSEKFIQNFLFLCKCKVEKAKQRIDMYYTLRSRVDLYENINPKNDNIKEVMEIIFWVLLPKMTEEMYRVWFFKVRNEERIDKVEPGNAFRVVMDLQEIRLHEDIMCGDIFIFDMNGVTFRYMTKFTPIFLAKIFMVYEKTYSIPLKKMVFINSPSYINFLITILKTLLVPKLFKRILVCQDTSILLEMFSDKIIPKDYGGKEKSFEELHEFVQIKFRQYQERFDQLDQLRVDESLRPENLKNDDFFGSYGSFRHMNID